MAGIQVKGVEQAIKSLRKFERELNQHLFEGVYEAARPVATEIRNRAPKGPTGNLRKSIQYGRLRKRLGRDIAAYVRVNYRTAPHAHLVEFGSGPRSTKSGKSTGVSPPRPFFRPVVDQVNAGTFAPVTAAGKRAVAKFKP